MNDLSLKGIARKCRGAGGDVAPGLRLSQPRTGREPSEAPSERWQKALLRPHQEIRRWSRWVRWTNRLQPEPQVR